MSVDTRAHIESGTLQERAVLRRTHIWGSGSIGVAQGGGPAVAIKGHNGDEIRVTLDDLGTALRVLKVSPTDLGYKR